MPTLKKTISRYLILLAVISIAVMLAASLCIQRSAERRHAYDSAAETLYRMEKVLEESRRELKETQEEYRQACLNNAETIALIIDENHGVVNDTEKLREIAEIIGVDEIHIFNDTGEIIAGTVPEYYGYTFDSGSQMAYFKPMLGDKTLELVQDITPNTAEGKLMQYSAVWDRNKDHILQVGMEPLKVMKVTEKNQLSYIFSLFWVNSDCNYYAINAESGKIAGSTVSDNVDRNAEDIGLNLETVKSQNNGFSAVINGRRYFCITRKVGDAYLMRTVLESTLYQRIPESILLLAACLILSVIVLCVGTAFCTNRFVISKIKKINEKLYSITMGNLDEEIDIKSSVEFAELSRYANLMIQSLLNGSKKMSHVLSKANLYIGVYEYNHSMKRVRYTEYLPSLLALDMEQMERIASDYSLFKEYIDGIRRHPVPGKPGVYRLSEGSSQRVRLEEAGNQNDILGIVILSEEEEAKKPGEKTD